MVRGDGVFCDLRCGPVRWARGASAAHGEAASVDLLGHLGDMRICVGEHVREHVNMGLKLNEGGGAVLRVIPAQTRERRRCRNPLVSG